MAQTAEAARAVTAVPADNDAGPATSGDRLPPTTAVVVAAVAATAPMSYGLVTTRSIWTFAVLAAVTVGGLGVLLGGGAFRRWWLAVTGLAVLSTVTGLVNVGFSRAHLTVGAMFVVLWGLLPVAARTLAGRPGFGALAGRWWVLGQSVSSAAAMVQVTGVTTLGWSLESGRTPGLSGHPNILGLLAAVAVLLCVHTLLAGSGVRTPVVVGLLLLNLAAVLASGSLTAMFSMLLGLVVVLAVYRSDSRVLISAVAVTVLVGTAAVAFGGELGFAAIGDRIAQTTGQDYGKVSTLDDRFDRFDVAWNGVLADPLYGAGLDDGSGSTTDPDAVAHDIVVRAWFQGGLALLAAVLTVYAMMITSVVRAVRTHTAAAGAGILALLFAFALTSASFSQPYFWLVAVGAWAVVDAGASAATGLGGSANRVILPPGPRASGRSRPAG